MFQDEARCGRISHTRYWWCPKPVRPLTHAMVTQEYTDAYAAVSPGDGVLDTLILPSVNGDCLQIFVDEIGARHGEENVLMVVDGAGWHRNQELRLPRNLQLLFLPPYAPELNPVEHLWDDVKSPSTTVSLTASSPWTHISNRRSPTSRSPPLVHEELRGGPGLLTHYLIRNRIRVRSKNKRPSPSGPGPAQSIPQNSHGVHSSFTTRPL